MRQRQTVQEKRAGASNSHRYHPHPGTSLWVRRVTCEQLAGQLLHSGIAKGMVTGVTVDPEGIGYAIRNSQVYDEAMFTKLNEGIFGEQLALALILNDARNAADILQTQYERTNGGDGWVALTVYPQMSADLADAVAAVTGLHRKMKRPNILMTLPGLPEWLPAIEQVIFSGVPVYLTALFSGEQFLGAAMAYLRGLDRRFRAGLKPVAASFAAVSMNNLVTALADDLPGQSASQAGIALARQMYQISRDLCANREWQRAEQSGARPLRLVWVVDDKSGTHGIDESCISDLRMPFSVTATPAMRWKKRDEQGISEPQMPATGDNHAGKFSIYMLPSGVTLDNIADRLQSEEVAAAESSWIELLDAVARKSALLASRSPTTFELADD